MSLSVSPELLTKAKGNSLMPEDFLNCMRSSLPKGFAIIDALGRDFKERKSGKVLFDPPSLDDETRGQLLRMFASDAMRNELKRWAERVGGVGTEIAFQNCHAVGVFDGTEQGKAALKRFRSREAQLLAQSPEKVDC